MKKLVPQGSVLVPDDATYAFEGKIFSVHEWKQQLYDGSTTMFEMLRRPDTTAIICIVDDKIIVLDDEQPRQKSLKCFPGGRVDTTDESLVAAAQREVLEETGYAFDDWRLVEVEQPEGKIEWFVHTFIAWNGRHVTAADPGPGERIQVSLETFETTKQLVMAGSGHLKESQQFFESAHSVEDLLNLPEFIGIEIER
ncbi:NUDIX domain-containing protein [Aeromicrobium sp.]|nr:NUDIX domain-containing protein [Candidatus Saccharibacteria bacterium]